MDVHPITSTCEGMQMKNFLHKRRVFIWTDVICKSWNSWCQKNGYCTIPIRVLWYYSNYTIIARFVLTIKHSKAIYVLRSILQKPITPIMIFNIENRHCLKSPPTQWHNKWIVWFKYFIVPTMFLGSNAYVA